MLEFHATTRGALKWRSGTVRPHQGCQSDKKGIISMLVDFGLTFDGRVCRDASAAMGISFRSRTRHLDVQYLWILEEGAEGRLKVDKVATKENTADILTKAVGKDVMQKPWQALDIELSNARAVKGA